MATLISRIFDQVAAIQKPPPLRQLRPDLQSARRDTRLIALVTMRKLIDSFGLRNSYFATAEPLTVDPDSTCRWQATIIIGEFIETQPDRVWQVARSLGNSRKADIRMAASTVLLEHLLEYHPTQMCALSKRSSLSVTSDSPTQLVIAGISVTDGA